MIERVARAIARADGSKITGPSRHRASDEFQWDIGHRYMDAYVEKHWQEHVTAANMVIEAMREPTTAMKDAACAIGPDTNSGEFDYDNVSDIYTAMIDKALEE